MQPISFTGLGQTDPVGYWKARQLEEQERVRLRDVERGERSADEADVITVGVLLQPRT
jgi:hypothetical protein